MDYIERIFEASGASTFDSDALRAFVETVSSPSRVRTSLVERLEVFHDHQRREAVSTYDLQGLGDVPAFVAVASFARGELAGDFDVRGHDETKLRVLSRFETAVLVWAAITSLIIQAYGLNLERAPEEGRRWWKRGGREELFDNHEDVLAELQLFYAMPAVLLRGFTLEGIDEKNYRPHDMWALNSLRAMSENLAANYVLVVEVPAAARQSSHIVLTQRTTVGTSEQRAVDRPRSRWKRLVVTLRRVLLISESEIVFDAIEARRCVDYHLTITSPPGALTARSRFQNDGELIGKARSARQRLTRFHVRTPRPRMARTLHLHTRNFGESQYTKPEVLVEYVEDLPGSISRAAVAAWSLVWVVWITAMGLGLAQDRQSGAAAQASEVGRTSRGSIESMPVDLDPVALVLALQGALVAWIFADIIRHPLGLSLRSRLSMIATAALSVVAGALLVLQTSNRVDRLEIPEKLSLLYVDDGWWVAVLAAALVAAIYITVTLCVRQSMERRERSRQPSTDS